MAYEHQGKANQLANSINRALLTLSDEVPNQQQIGQLLAESFVAFGLVEQVVQEEEKPAFRAKFAAVSSISLLRKVAPRLKLSEQGLALLEVGLKSVEEALAVGLPDEIPS